MTNVLSKIRFLWKVLGSFKPLATLLLFLIILSSITETISLTMMLPFFEELLHAERVSTLTQYFSPILNKFTPGQRVNIMAFLVLLMIVIKNTFSILRASLSIYFVWKLRENWMQRIMSNFLYAPYYKVIENKQGVFLNNLISEPNNAAASLTDLIEYVAKVTISIGLLFALLVIDWKITILISFLFAVLFWGINRFVYKFAGYVGKIRIGLSQELTAQGAEAISGIRELKIFSIEDKINKLFRDRLKRLTSLLLKFKIINRLSDPVAEFLIVICVVILLFYINTILKRDILSILPLLGVFVIISQRLSSSLSSLYSQRNEILTFLPSLKLVYELTSINEIEKNSSNGVKINKLTGEIIFQDVKFSYQDNQILFGKLTFTIPCGKMSAIIGPSGAGKSTVADLLIGLFQKDGGQILINGIDLSEINLSSWRRRVGFVSQETFLLNTSIKENIIIGKPEATDEEVIEAAKKANVHKFITSLPDNYNTIIGDRGVKLSGGERQRIAIARAIIRNPDLFIFDEATSSLDVETEKMIQKSIEEIGKEKTVLIITHRLSTIENADVVYRIDKGKIEKIREGASFRPVTF